MSGELLIPAAVSALIFVLVMLSSFLIKGEKDVQDRIKRITTPVVPMDGESSTNAIMDSLYAEEKPEGLAVPMAAILSLMGTDLAKFTKDSQMRFYRAGATSANAPIYYLFFKRFGIFIFGGLAYLMATLPGGTMMHLMHYMMALMLVLFGFYGGDILLGNNETKRKKILQRSFPDALDLLLVCVESGLALDGALSRVCKELGRAYPEMAAELNRTRLELTLLNGRSQALVNLAERTDMLCFRALTTTLLQSEKFGTSLTDTLRVLSEDFRNTRLMQAEEKAGRLPVLMTVPLIVLMMPALFLIILGPTIIKLMALPPTGS